VGSGIEIFGVLIIVTGIAWSTCLHLRQPMPGEDTEVYKIRPFCDPWDFEDRATGHLRARIGSALKEGKLVALGQGYRY
jgi:hypothetical protein